MANISRMTGTPWHVETLRMKDGDTARHCHRCVYYSKSNRYCSAIMGRCFGSAHCEHYSETSGTPSISSINFSSSKSVSNRYQTTEKTTINNKVNKPTLEEVKKDAPAKVSFSNFSFMESVCPDVAMVGAAAEKHYKDDSNAAIFKVGLLSEILVSEIFRKERLSYLEQDKQIDSIAALKDEELIPEEIESMLTAIRIDRNRAVHDNFDSKETAAKLLKYAFELCNWYMEVYGSYGFKPAQYVDPADFDGKEIDAEKKIEELRRLLKEKNAVITKQNKPERVVASKKVASSIKVEEQPYSVEDGVIVQANGLSLVDNIVYSHIDEIYVENNTDKDIEGLTIAIKAHPALCNALVKHLPVVKAHKSYSIKDVELFINEDYLSKVTYDTNCYLEITVSHNGKTVSYDYADLEIDENVLDAFVKKSNTEYSNILSIRGEEDDYYVNPDLEESPDRIYVPCGFGNSDQGFFIYGIKKAKLCQHEFGDIYALVYNYMVRNSRMDPNELPEILKKLDSPIAIDYKPIYRLAIIMLQMIRHNYANTSLSINYDGPKSNFDYAVMVIDDYAKRYARLLKIAFKPIVITNSLKGQKVSSDKPIGIYALNNTELLTNAREIWYGHKLTYKLNKTDLPDLEYILKEISSFDTFREGQFEALAGMLSSRKNAVTIMPTGSGKSFIYYMASLLEPLPIFVVAPTDILIEDQLRNLHKFHNMDNAAHLKMVEDADFRDYNIHNSINYLTPATLTNRHLFSRFRFTFNTGENLRSEKIAPGPMIGLIVLDEIHCISNWGHDFRPEYLMLSRNLQRNLDHVGIWGFTATANYTVVEDIQQQLNIPTENFFSPIAFEKYNVNYDYRECRNEEEMYDLVSEIANSCAYRNERTLVFTKSDEISRKVADAIGYEADIFSSDNPQSYYYFVDGKCKILIAAEELGVGINFPNIRNIIHFGMPLSKNEYVQEIGRAGRANERVTSYVLYLKNAEPNAPRGLVRRNLDINRLGQMIEGLDNDYSRIYRKLTNNCPTLETLYDQLIYLKDRIAGEGSGIIKWYFDDQEIVQVKKELFMLFTCGFIRDWYTYDRTKEDGTSILIDYDTSMDQEHIKQRMHTSLRDYFSSLDGDNRKAMVEAARATSIDEIIKAYVKWYFERYLYHHNEEFIDMYEFITGNKVKESEKITDEIKDYFTLPFMAMKNEESEYNDMDIKQIAEKAVAGFSQSTISNVERINSNRYSYKLDFLLFVGRLRNFGVLEESRLSRIMSNVPENRKSTVDGLFEKLYPSCEIDGRLAIVNYLEKNGRRHGIKVNDFIDEMYQNNGKDELYYAIIAKRINDIFTNIRREQ